VKKFRINLGMTIFLVVLCSAFLSGFENSDNDTSSFFCVFPLLIIFIFICLAGIKGQIDSNDRKNIIIDNQKNLQELLNGYEQIKEKSNIPTCAKKISFIKASNNSPIMLAKTINDIYIWKTDGDICFFPASPKDINSFTLSDVKQNSIPISDIEYFSKRGKISRETKISGGGGGGSSLGGAVTGALLAGDAGAVIGSRKKVEGIKSEVVTHDSRETFLNFFDENKNRHSLFFDINGYHVLNDLIPEKEFSIVSAIKSSGIIRTQTMKNEKQDIPSQIRELSKLKDEGILTEQEFTEKKKVLLDKIN
jgi:hypothetical protein